MQDKSTSAAGRLQSRRIDRIFPPGMALYPLKFVPRLVEKMWGGRKLQEVLGKPLPEGKPIGESWELYDFPPGVVEDDGNGGWVSSPVANGPLAGRTLHELIGQYGKALHGDVALAGPHGQFPLLLKYLDAREALSVQVHPDQEYVQANPGAHLKNEAWYIVQSDPSATLYAGLKDGVTREQLAKAAGNGAIEKLIHTVHAREGQCLYLPSGMVHALGAGILVAEVQTPSDTTFRIYDFGRTDPSTGRPRDLHIAQALQCIDFLKHNPIQPRSHVAGTFTTVTRLVTCEHFVVEKVRFSGGVEQPVPYDQPVLWMVLQGSAQVTVRGVDEPVTIARGDTVLLPAEMDEPVLKTVDDCVWLEITVP